MTEPTPRVYIVDDDPAIRKSLTRLIRVAGYDVESYESAREFLACELYDGPCCLVLDVRMPGLTGLDLQEEMNRAGLDVPVVFITGHGDVPMSVKAMKAGAVDFLPKPFEDDDLLEAIERSHEQHIRSRAKSRERASTQRRVASLSHREHQVFTLVVTGMLNKQIAAQLGVTEKTIKAHRAHVMQKMEVVSLAELVRLAERFGGISIKGNLITGEIFKE